MGQQHNELNRAVEIDHAVRVIVSETDSESKVERFSETLTPILDIWSRPEWAFLRNEVLFSVGPQTSAAVAAQSSFVQLFNPVTSTRIVVITGAAFKATVLSTDVNLGVTAIVRGASFDGAVALDSRYNEGGLWVGREPLSASFGALAPPFGTDLLVGQDSCLVAGQWQPFRNFPTIILSPGFGCNISNATLNSVIAVTFSGYGRPARKEELA